MLQFQRTLAIVLLLLLTACASGSHTRKILHASLPDESDFSLDVIDTTYISNGKAAAFALEIEPSEELLTVRVLASDAAELKALAFGVEYDPALMRIQSVAGLGGFTGDTALSLVAHSGNCAKLAPGRVECCFRLVGPEGAEGFTGSGALAELVFKPGSEVERAASATPGFADFVRDLTLSGDGGRLSWAYRNTRDYDLNGETASAGDLEK